MKVIFHPRFYEVYTSDPAAAPGRMEPMVKALEKEFEFVEPGPASERDLERVHGKNHIQSVKKEPQVYEVGILAAGGAILAAEMAFEGQPAFGLIRPPGHHASPHSCWGFCYFNNIAIAIKKLLSEGKIKGALILDFDLHYGDGTSNTFDGFSSISYFHPEATRREEFLQQVQTMSSKPRGLTILSPSRQDLTATKRIGEDFLRPKTTSLSENGPKRPRSNTAREGDSAFSKEAITIPSSAET